MNRIDRRKNKEFRHFVELSKRGHAVTGIDLPVSQFKRAKEKAKELDLKKERGRRRSLALRKGRVTQSQPKSGRPIEINDGEFRFWAVCGVGRSALITTSSRFAYGQNSGFQCPHYLLMAQ
jgi:hypothetical protein